MANAATVQEKMKFAEACTGGSEKPLRIAGVHLSFDENYAQGGYDILPLIQAQIPECVSVSSLFFLGLAFVDSPGGAAYIPHYYPSAHKVMFYKSVEAANADTIKEIDAGALGATFVLDALVYYREA